MKSKWIQSSFGSNADAMILLEDFIITGGWT